MPYLFRMYTFLIAQLYTVTPWNGIVILASLGERLKQELALAVSLNIVNSWEGSDVRTIALGEGNLKSNSK